MTSEALSELEDGELEEMPSLEHGAIGIRLGLSFKRRDEITAPTY
jgi:hypothetical protein